MIYRPKKSQPPPCPATARIASGKVVVTLPEGGALTAAEARQLAGMLFTLAHEVTGGEPFVQRTRAQREKIVRKF